MPEGRANDLRIARMLGGVRSVPTDVDPLGGNESLDGVRHVGHPSTAAKLAIAEHTDARVPLHAEGFEDRLILDGSKLIEAEGAPDVRLSSI